MPDDDVTPELEALPRTRADGWWLVTRLPDDHWPDVWHRQPIAAWGLTQTTEARPSALVAVLGDGSAAPLRPAVEGRDGADFHQRCDAFHPCRCDVSPRSELDPMFCRYCAGVGEVRGVRRPARAA